MGDLLDALRTETGRTENGMPTNTTTLNSCVDLFFQIGAMRGQDTDRLISLFSSAYVENPLIAMKLLFWARDVRGGAGEREIFKVISKYLVDSHKESIQVNLALIPEFGRWDDLLVFIGTELESDVLSLIKDGLSNDETKGLCAKWMPRQHATNPDKKRAYHVIRKYLKMTPKSYRKMLVELSNTVEQKMCAKDFNNIDYSKLPSKAMSDYMKAFSRNDGERFSEYLSSVQKGETTINTGAVYPYDIIKNLKHGNSNGADTQWAELPNYLEGNQERLLPLVDVSGSMSQLVNGNPNLNVMDIAISLGLYISERNEGKFHNGFLTFHSDPQLLYTNGKLSDRFIQMCNAPWGATTNVVKAFDLILNQAVKFNVSEDEMPTMLIILSDMEFDTANSTSYWGGTPIYTPTAQKAIADRYAKAGYTMPKIVYWNLAARNRNFPVQFKEDGTALISSFSPAILKSVLAGDDMTPESMMMKVVNDERYSNVNI